MMNQTKILHSELAGALQRRERLDKPVHIGEIIPNVLQGILESLKQQTPPSSARRGMEVGTSYGIRSCAQSART